MTIAWFSCGATSAVACKLALQMYDDVRIFYIETNSGHPDNERFIKDCEREVNRAIRFRQQNPDTKPLFPLIEREISKPDALGMLWKAGIEIPAMYRLGYSNNNCIGCVKGGIGYWNKIRRDFPDRFRRMAEIERIVGATCLKDEHGRIWLDELDPTRGDDVKAIMPECSIICQIEFANIEDPQTQLVMSGQMSINETR